jgi:hypothetical protein
MPLELSSVVPSLEEAKNLAVAAFVASFRLQTAPIEFSRQQPEHLV